MQYLFHTCVQYLFHTCVQYLCTACAMYLYLCTACVQYLCATGVCISLLMVAVAATELSRHIARLTAFTHEIFACFVCSIYVVDGVRGVLGRFGGRPAQFGEALFATNLSLLTFGASAWLSSALRWRVLSVGLRTFLADYAVTFAVVATTVRAAALHAEGYNPACWRLRPGTVEAAALRISSPVRYQVASFCVSGVAVERISLPSHLSPTCFLAGGGRVHLQCA